MESGYESSERNSSSPVSMDMPLSESSSTSRDSHIKRTGAFVPAWRNIPKSHSSSILEVESVPSASCWTKNKHSIGNGEEILVSSKSELDELQEEVARRAQEQELRRKQEKELEASVGFNPRPSRFMDLDELQNQGRTDGFERSVQEADSVFEESLHQEQRGDCAAALALCNEAISKLRLAMHDASSSTHSRSLIDKKLQICIRKERSLQDRMQQQQPAQPPPTCHPPRGGNMTHSTSEQTVALQVLLNQKIALEPSREAELGSNSYFHPTVSHHEMNSSHVNTFLPPPSESSPSHKTSLNFQAASAGNSDQTLSFSCMHGVGDRSIQTENEIHCDVELERVSSISLKEDKDCSKNNKLEEVHNVTASLTPYRKMKCNMVNSGSLPTLFPSSHSVPVPSDKIGLHNPCFKPSNLSEWHSVAQQGANHAMTLASHSPLPHHPPDPLPSTNRYLRTNSDESLHLPQEEFVNGDSLKSEKIHTKGRVRLLAEQFQQPQGVSQREFIYGKERKVPVYHNQNDPKLLQESYSCPFLDNRQPVVEQQENGMWSAEKLNSCLSSRDKLSSKSCFGTHNKISKTSDSQNKDPRFYPGRFNHEGEVRQANDRNHAGLVASMPVDCCPNSVKKYYSSQVDCKNTSWSPVSNQITSGEDLMQKHPQWNRDTELEISELESLYQASLQAPQTSQPVLGRLDNSWHLLGTRASANLPTRKMHGATCMGLSKTPTAEIERNLYGTIISPFSKVPYTRNNSKEPEEEMYSAENFRRIARSLSGTVITNKEETLVSSHSFEVASERKMPVEARHRSSSTTSLTFPHDFPSVLPFDPRHFSTQLQHLSHDAPVPSMVGKSHRQSGNQKNIQKILAVPDRGEAFQGEDNPGLAMSYGSPIYRQQCLSSQGQKTLLSMYLGTEEASSISGHWPQMNHTARQTATLPDRQAEHWRYAAQKSKGSQEHLLQQPFQQGEQEACATDNRPSVDSTLCVSHGASKDIGSFQGCPVPPQYAKPPGPRRVDMPPDEDWRKYSYAPQPGARRILPVYSMDGTYSSTSEMHRKVLAHVAAASMHNSG